MKKLLAVLFFVSCSAPTTGTLAPMFKQGEGLNPAEGHPLAGVKQGVGPSPAALGALCFSPGKCDLQIVSIIDGAKKTIDAAVYGLNRPSLADALMRAKKRGLLVRLIADSVQSRGAKEVPVIAALLKAGIPIKRNTSYLMHDKFCVVDGATVTTGSMNWTNNGVEHNQENLLVLKSSDIADSYSAVFERMWGKFPDLKQ